MRCNLTAFAAPCLLLTLCTGGVSAEENMMSTGDAMSTEGGMMAGEDSMAMPAIDCVATAYAETDAIRLQPMLDACATMYPALATMDPMAVECFAAAHVEADMTKMAAMNTECMTKYPDAMAMGQMAPSAM
ncbi:MAG: hypothetical protein JWR75_1400 [Devosia sp.]|nr:hypothetical protein [Devosia sp.]